MKKLLSIGMCVLLAISLCAAPVLAETPSYLAASTPEYTTFGSSPFFFANGTPITIAENPDGAGALITWEGGSQVVAANTNVFGLSLIHICCGAGPSRNPYIIKERRGQVNRKVLLRLDLWRKVL